MQNMYIQKLIYSVLVLLILTLAFQIARRHTKKNQEKLGLSRSRYFTLLRLFRFLYLGMMFFALVLIWGVNFKHLWVSVTGVLALIAVAFFAVWSLVGNILAGVILYFTVPFRIEDSIEIIPDNIQGKVLAINTFYTLLQNEEGDYISVPNSLFFQKYIRKITKK